ncbi:MAG: hypothetical protein C0397_19345 [Odoribacter sp.]|nr:hypothetical protein [Odoribacter sp.]
MKDTIKEQQFSFLLKGIELLDVKLNHLKQPLPVQTTFHFNIGLEHQINNENKLIIVVTTVDIIHEDNETRLASIKASCIYEIANFEDFLIVGSQQVSFPDTMLITLNSISLSTVRGIMFSQFKGTFLHTAFLPIIDPKTFVKNSTD